MEIAIECDARQAASWQAGLNLDDALVGTVVHLQGCLTVNRYSKRQDECAVEFPRRASAQLDIQNILLPALVNQMLLKRAFRLVGNDDASDPPIPVVFLELRCAAAGAWDHGLCGQVRPRLGR